MNRTVIAIGLALTMAAGTATAEAAAPAASSVGVGVAETLAAVSGAHLLVADASSGCMATGTEEPVVVRSDRILVRTSEKDDRLLATVLAGAASLGSGWSIAPAVSRRVDQLGSVASTPVVVVGLGTAATEATQVLQLVRALRAVGVEASPDYGLSPSGGPLGMWPYGPPVPTSAPLPTPRSPRIGAGVTVALYDTGLPIDRYGAAASANLALESDIDKPDQDADGIADLPFTGHTIAIASVLATLAPAAEVVALRISDDGGVPTDLSVADGVIRSFDNNQFSPAFWPDIIVLPFGTPACDDLKPLAMETVVQQLVADGRSQLVASAGNRSSDRPFFPAAFDGVLAVGSLDLTADRDRSAWTSPNRAGPRSAFSNYGPWVDVWAGGEHLVTRHVTGLGFYPGGPVLGGIAEVSGTSFAAPAVAALLAEGVARTGRPAAWVWTHLLRPSGTRCPASGGGVAVALTEMDESFTERADRVRHSPC